MTPRRMLRPRPLPLSHPGGAWKLAYGDFVTAMMALFLVLWLLSQADLKLRSQIARYFREPGIMPGGTIVSLDSGAAKQRTPIVVANEVLVQGMGEQRQLAGQAAAVKRAVAEAAEDDPSLAGIQDRVVVQVTPRGLVIQVVDKDQDVLFDVASSTLKPSLVALLARLAGELTKLPNTLEIEGHTDARPYAPGSVTTNWELSFLRADAARRVLESHGIRAGQVQRVVAYADTQPLMPSDPLAPENRRLSIVAVRRTPKPRARVVEEPFAAVLDTRPVM